MIWKLCDCHGTWYITFLFSVSRGLAQKNHWSATNIQGKPRKSYTLVNILSKRGLDLWAEIQLNQYSIKAKEELK